MTPKTPIERFREKFPEPHNGYYTEDLEKFLTEEILHALSLAEEAIESRTCYGKGADQQKRLSLSIIASIKEKYKQ